MPAPGSTAVPPLPAPPAPPAHAPGAAPRFGTPGTPDGFAPVPPEPARETYGFAGLGGTVPGRALAGAGGRRLLAAACLVVGLGLLGGAIAGAALNGGPRPRPALADGSPEAFAAAREVWRDTPVADLFPPRVAAKGGGPGGADRSWVRIGVAAPAGCAGAFDPLLQKVLAPVGCARLLRATYVDSTSTTVTTVGLLVASGQAQAMSALAARWTSQHLGERTDLLPRPAAFPGTPAARFGPHQRGSWDVRISAGLPFVVYAVSGFADGRTVPQPQPADQADASGATTAAAQAGLGYDAGGLARAVDTRLQKAVTTLLHPPTKGPQQR